MYNVAFVYTEKVKGYEGIRTWTTFKSKKAFDAWYTPEMKARETVLAKGISDEECVKLVQKTPVASQLAAALQNARSPKTGKINPFALRMGLRQIVLAKVFRA